jgi:hypothetical protein
MHKTPTRDSILTGERGSNGENCIMGNFVVCTLHHITLTVIISRSLKLAGSVAPYVEDEKFLQNVVVKPEGSRLFGGPTHGRKDNINVAVIEIGLEEVDWIPVA